MRVNHNDRYLFVFSAIVALCNMLLNAVVIWSVWRNTPQLGMWGDRGIATYLCASSFIVGFIICWITTRYTRASLRAKRIIQFYWHTKGQTLIDHFPDRTFPRSFVIGLAGIILAALNMYGFKLLKTDHLPFSDFMIYISIYAAIAGFAGSILSIYRALGDKIGGPVPYTSSSKKG